MPKKYNIKRWFRYKYLLFIRIKDNPRNIAVGAALGIAFDVLPTFGLGVIVAYFIATLLKVNRLATIISAVVFKAAIPFFVFINYKVGRFLLHGPHQVNKIKVYHAQAGFDWSHLGTSFLLGSVINSVIFYSLTYFLIYQFVNWRRSRAARLKK